MATASATIDIPASADQVWQLIGGFNTLPDWLPLITESTLTDGGRVRSLKIADGGVVIERLQTFDNAAMTYSYSIEQAPFPATDYLATLKVEAQGQGARVTWSGRFTALGVSDEEVVALFNGIYQGGLDALRANYPT
ncbi:SRPBCC family protein [Pseudomonas granadensis]|uniref:SRPBCC family protein n=1 Tax=Pseudomonas granadensis TaxID=1421430 RepID=A0ABX7GB35_9PSED|nr:SRPBCC family protein [Pseudomonas granadensis]MBN6775760.1 SRPBCC family protein [Pseudomonas granadensis]MBN6806946.1 SRPBCC family protein [Pseudomonas granadensis]MBN6833786.1 SRPBCC family protein [Pseudomonas granadensis]MBN6841192.1 SRPBCC family protein [Pseudomonas granadensis]MBN6869974.1 SRPBCC family protein [Pseudomonas granadensis]